MKSCCFSSTFLAILFSVELLAHRAAADQELYAAIIDVQSAREEIYGNGHFVWHDATIS